MWCYLIVFIIKDYKNVKIVLDYIVIFKSNIDKFIF